MSDKDRLLFIPVEGDIEQYFPEDSNDAQRWLRMKTCNELLDTFRGEWEGEVGIFFADDLGLLKRLPVNLRATEVYHKCCRPGVSQPIVGNVVGFFGRWAE